MRDQKSINEKIRQSLKNRNAIFGSPMTGRAGKKHSEESKALISLRVKQTPACQPKVTEDQKRARNKANVYAYRARLKNAIPEDADLKLIQKIYEMCPSGYHVDHRVALAVGGQHHQSNLQYLPTSENCRKGKGTVYNESLVIKWQDMFPDSSVGRVPD